MPYVLRTVVRALEQVEAFEFVQVSATHANESMHVFNVNRPASLFSGREAK